MVFYVQILVHYWWFSSKPTRRWDQWNFVVCYFVNRCLVLTLRTNVVSTSHPLFRYTLSIYWTSSSDTPCWLPAFAFTIALFRPNKFLQTCYYAYANLCKFCIRYDGGFVLIYNSRIFCSASNNCMYNLYFWYFVYSYVIPALIIIDI